VKKKRESERKQMNSSTCTSRVIIYSLYRQKLHYGGDHDKREKFKRDREIMRFQYKRRLDE